MLKIYCRLFFSPLKKNWIRHSLCTCRSILNAFCIANFVTKIWIYPFYFQWNHFSPLCLHLGRIPPRSTLSSSTNLLSSQYMLLMFLFVVDLCIFEEEIRFLRFALLQVVELLPLSCTTHSPLLPYMLADPNTPFLNTSSFSLIIICNPNNPPFPRSLYKGII